MTSTLIRSILTTYMSETKKLKYHNIVSYIYRYLLMQQTEKII
jgi:hypothetical protein